MTSACITAYRAQGAIAFPAYAQPQVRDVVPYAISGTTVGLTTDPIIAANTALEVIILGSGFEAFSNDSAVRSAYLRCGYGFDGDDWIERPDWIRPNYNAGYLYSRSDDKVLLMAPTVFNDSMISCYVPYPPPALPGSKIWPLVVASVRVALNGQSFTNTTGMPTLTYDTDALHVPELVDAYYSSDLTMLMVVFDRQPTNRAGMVGMAPCRQIFDTETIASLKTAADLSYVPQCGWQDDSTVVVYLSSVSNIAAGLKITLKPNLIRPKAAGSSATYDLGYCANPPASAFEAGGRCSQPFAKTRAKSALSIRVHPDYACDQRATLERETCTLPKAEIRAPEEISMCSNSALSFDGSRSVGGGARPLHYKWMAVPRESDNYFAFQQKLDELGSVAVPTLSAADLAGGNIFTVRLVVTDVFGVQSPPASATVRRSNRTIPSVEIEAPALTYIRSSGKVCMKTASHPFPFIR